MSTRDISFASFNLYNLQEAGEKVYRKTVKKREYEAKVNWSAEMLALVDAEVIAFQELWSRPCLIDVFQRAGLAADYELVYIKDGSQSWRGIAVAAAVKRPWRVKTRRRIKRFPFQTLHKLDTDDDEDDEVDLKINRFSRTILDLTISNEDVASVPDIRVFAPHLKAKLPTRVRHVASKHRAAIGSAVSTIRRTAEAAALRWILTNTMKKTHVPTVVIGDLNDDPRSNTLALLTEQPSMSPSARGGDTALYSAIMMQQLISFRDVLYTHEFNRLRDTLDHVLVSEQFFASSPDHRWSLKNVRIWNDFIDDEESRTSDHGLMKASFDWG